MTDPRAVLRDHIRELRHIGFVVPELAEAIAEARRVYGLAAEDIEYQPGPDVDSPTRFAFFRVGGVEFEYIEPRSAHFRQLLLGMSSGGAGINHVAWEVDDIDAAVTALAARGIHPGHVTPEGVISMGNRKMVYLDPATTGGLVIELLENRRASCPGDSDD